MVIIKKIISTEIQEIAYHSFSHQENQVDMV